MKEYKAPLPFTVAMKLLKPTSGKVKGVTQKAFSDPEEAPLIFGAFRTYGGTEIANNGVITIYDTANVDTYYNPDITSDCRIYLCDTGEVYDVINRPEDINMRHQYMRFKVRKIGGKA